MRGVTDALSLLRMSKQLVAEGMPGVTWCRAPRERLSGSQHGWLYQTSPEVILPSVQYQPCSQGYQTMRKVVNFICAALLVGVGLCLTISICILVFIFTGQLQVGNSLGDGDVVPKVSSLLCFQALCIFLMAALILMRAKVGKQYDFKFLRPRDI